MSRNYFSIISLGDGRRFLHRDSAAILLRRFRSGCCADLRPPLLPILRRKFFTVGGVLFILCQGGMHVHSSQKNCASGVSDFRRCRIVLVVSPIYPGVEAHGWGGGLVETLLLLRLPFLLPCVAGLLRMTLFYACLCCACRVLTLHGQCRQESDALPTFRLRPLYGSTWSWRCCEIVSHNTM